MTNATIIKNANKRNVFTLIIVIFLLTENCLAEKPIANYCLDTKKGYSLKLESIIDSSVFTKMEERNCWMCSQKKTYKRYFAKIESRDSMTCSFPGESIFREYSFLFKNMNLNATYDFWDTVRGQSEGIGGCLDCSTFLSSSSEKKSSSSLGKNYSPVEASTEILIDFPYRILEVVQDVFEINEIKSSFGNTIPISWKFKISCPPHRDTTITGSYFVRITGECGKK
jgi:hypothetical protein